MEHEVRPPATSRYAMVMSEADNQGNYSCKSSRSCDNIPISPQVPTLLFQVYNCDLLPIPNIRLLRQGIIQKSQVEKARTTTTKIHSLISISSGYTITVLQRKEKKRQI